MGEGGLKKDKAALPLAMAALDGGRQVALAVHPGCGESTGSRGSRCAA